MNPFHCGVCMDDTLAILKNQVPNFENVCDDWKWTHGI
jgi:hypothetical protein